MLGNPHKAYLLSLVDNFIKTAGCCGWRRQCGCRLQHLHPVRRSRLVRLDVRTRVDRLDVCTFFFCGRLLPQVVVAGGGNVVAGYNIFDAHVRS